MKQRVCFNFEKGQIAQFNKIVPATLRSRMIRQYLLYDYRLTDTVAASLSEENETYPFLFDELCNTKLDELQKEAVKYSTNINKSSIMRDVIRQFLLVYTDPIKPPKRRAITFNVENGTIEKLEKYIPENERSATIQDYILSYEITYKSPEELKKRPAYGIEMMMLYLDITAIERLDDIAKQLNSKRTYILRDVLNAMLNEYEDINPRHAELEYKFKQTMEELQRHMEQSQINELIKPYLINKGGNIMNEKKEVIYETKEETLIIPDKKPDVEYEINSEKD